MNYGDSCAAEMPYIGKWKEIWKIEKQKREARRHDGIKSKNWKRTAEYLGSNENKQAFKWLAFSAAAASISALYLWKRYR